MEVCEAVCRLLQQGLLCCKNQLPGRKMSVALLAAVHDVHPALQAAQDDDWYVEHDLIWGPLFRTA